MVQQRPSSILSVRQFGYNRKNSVEVHLRPDRIFLLIHPILTNLKPEPFLTATMNPHGWPAVIQTTAIFFYQTLSLLIQRGNVGNFPLFYGENEFPARREAHLKRTYTSAVYYSICRLDMRVLTDFTDLLLGVMHLQTLSKLLKVTQTGSDIVKVSLPDNTELHWPVFTPRSENL